MKKLILENFTCFQDNDGDNSDSPYFVIFTGRSSNPSAADVHPIYLPSLDDTVAATGNPTPVHKEVSKDVDESSIVIVALLERDDGIDLSGEELDNVQTWMRNKFVQHSKSGNFPTKAKLTKRMKREFIATINANTGNDDLIGVAGLPIPAAGQPPALDLQDDPDSGHYKVTLRVA